MAGKATVEVTMQDHPYFGPGNTKSGPGGAYRIDEFEGQAADSDDGLIRMVGTTGLRHFSAIATLDRQSQAQPLPNLYMMEPYAEFQTSIFDERAIAVLIFYYASTSLNSTLSVHIFPKRSTFISHCTIAHKGNTLQFVDKATAAIMLSTSDTITLVFGLASLLVAILAILVTITIQKAPVIRDIEMQPYTRQTNEHELTLKAMEFVLELFRRHR
ncbi:hypothetical protein BDZ45DRAFT_744742 [Acephala macrosclerotiorum]|nr:hypothetical protein BDZ45DRAFT_744742 [Acephala macrosclerotiorum]